MKLMDIFGVTNNMGNKFLGCRVSGVFTPFATPMHAVFICFYLPLFFSIGSFYVHVLLIQ
jgi:hypothetical protein